MVRLAFDRKRDPLEYDCADCRAKGRDSRRACFRFNTRQRVARVSPQEIGDDVDFVDASEAWRRAINVETLISKSEAWNIVRCAEELGVCPEGLHADPQIAEWIEAEMIAGNYHIPPVPGSLEDMPATMFDAFLVINQTRTRCQNEALAKIPGRKKAAT